MSHEIGIEVSDMSPSDIKSMLEQYEFQIRDALRVMRKAPTIVEARIALNAANTARRNREWLLKAMAA